MKCSAEFFHRNSGEEGAKLRQTVLSRGWQTVETGMKIALKAEIGGEWGPRGTLGQT